MSLPPYMLGGNAWAAMMAQQQLVVAAQQQHQRAAQQQAAAVHAAHQQALHIPPPLPKPDVMTEEKLQEKGNESQKHY